MTDNYSVNIEAYAQRHYVKSFEKKYKKHWDITLKALISQFERIDMLLLRDVAETICIRGHIKMVKTYFTVAGTGKSPKGSGNRCIIAVDESCRKVSVLLVYHKNDLGDENETARWKQVVKGNYEEYGGWF